MVYHVHSFTEWKPRQSLCNYGRALHPYGPGQHTCWPSSLQIPLMGQVLKQYFYLLLQRFEPYTICIRSRCGNYCSKCSIIATLHETVQELNKRAILCTTPLHPPSTPSFISKWYINTSKRHHSWPGNTFNIPLNKIYHQSIPKFNLW